MKLAERPAASRAGTAPVVVFVVVTAMYWASMYLYMPILSVHSEKNVGASMGMLGAILGSYGFAQLVLRIPLGVWSDRLGRRKPFVLAGCASTALAALIMGLSTDRWRMLLGRALSGVGAAAWVAFTVLFASYFAQERSARALGLVSFVNSASIMVSSLAGGIVADRLGWTAPFFAAAGFGLAGLIAGFALFEKPSPPRAGVTPRQLLRTCTVPALIVYSAISALSTWTIWTTANSFTPLYASQLGAGRGDLGLLATAAQGANAIATLGSPFLAERIGARTTIVLGILVQAAGAAMVPFSHSFEPLLLSQVLVGGGRAMLYPVTMALSVNAVGPADRATAMGVYQAVYAVGMFAGPASAGLIGDALGMASVFFVSTLVTLTAVPLMLVTRGK